MAYSLDLRERVVRSRQNGRAKLWIAREFGIGISTVKRYIKRYEQTGNVQVQRQGRMQPKIGEGERAALQAQVDVHSEATLEEHIALWAASHGVRVSPSTMCRALQKVDRPRKKDKRGERTRPPRADDVCGCGQHTPGAAPDCG
jgi:transposase